MKNIFAIFTALFSIASMFQSDSAKIVSKKGERILDDETKMKSIREKISALENQKIQEVFI
jgi:hypothetical protein